MAAPAPPQKWALITGVSKGGLGDALVTELMSRHINVIATALSLDLLDYLEAPSGTTTRIEKLQLDVTNPSSISAAAATTHSITNGKLNYLFNNAGYGYMMPLLDCSIEQMKHNFDVNVFGLLAVTQAFFPMVKAAQGVVVNQGSIAGLEGTYQSFIGSYGASKSAVGKLSDTLRVEVAPLGVKVVTLVTGDVQTRFWYHVQGADAGLPDGSPYQPIKAKAEAMMRGETNPAGKHSRERWAKEVIGDLLKSSPPSHVRRGYLARTMWLVSWLGPFWVLDWLYAQVGDLGKLKSALAAQDTKDKTQ